MKSTLIIIAIYVAHVFISRWIFKKAYQLNKDESIKGHVSISLIPIVGITASIVGYIVEYNWKNRGKNNWFNGKNW